MLVLSTKGVKILRLSRQLKEASVQCLGSSEMKYFDISIEDLPYDFHKVRAKH